MIKVSWTFEVVSPKSASRGDFERHGWARHNGINLEEGDSEHGDYADSEFDTVEDAVKAISNALGYMEPSCYPLQANQLKNVWLTSADPETDYHTAEETRYSVHFDESVSDSQLIEIFTKLGFKLRAA